MIRTVGIVSLSSGILGEPFVQHEVRLGLARLQDYGLQVRFLPHARAGLEALRAHPEWRAEDLLQAFRDPEIDLSSVPSAATTPTGSRHICLRPANCSGP